jgi:hypothetical protein
MRASPYHVCVGDGRGEWHSEAVRHEAEAYSRQFTQLARQRQELQDILSLALCTPCVGASAMAAHSVPTALPVSTWDQQKRLL